MTLGARMWRSTVMANSDYIGVQLQLNESTRGIIDRRRSTRSAGAILVNAARAAYRGPRCAVDALKSGRLAGLGMDIGYAEPADPDDPLLAFDKGNVILQPHLAVADRIHGLNDIRQLCLNLWRATLPRDYAPIRSVLG